MVPRHTARAIVMHDGKLLLMERWRAGMHYFSIPGGGIEEGESPEQTVVRELMEETGCVITPLREIYLFTSSDQSEHHFFLCEYVSGTPHLPLDAPEAARTAEENRYLPGWVASNMVTTIPFTFWEPIRNQLVHDIAAGFPMDVVRLP